MSVNSSPLNRIRGRIAACLSCGHEIGCLTPSKAMHAAGVRCDRCDRFIKWLARDFVESLKLPQGECHERI
jgi:hypothetical protein